MHQEGRSDTKGMAGIAETVFVELIQWDIVGFGCHFLQHSFDDVAGKEGRRELTAPVGPIDR